MSPDWEFNPDKDANDMTPEQLKASLAASLASIKAGKHHDVSEVINNIDDGEEDEIEDTDATTVPGWFKLVASLVLFSPFIISALYIILR